jgi:hypothetical protein
LLFVSKQDGLFQKKYYGYVLPQFKNSIIFVYQYEKPIGNNYFAILHKLIEAIRFESWLET